jgi:hypothetical protein
VMPQCAANVFESMAQSSEHLELALCEIHPNGPRTLRFPSHPVNCPIGCTAIDLHSVLICRTLRGALAGKRLKEVSSDGTASAIHLTQLLRPSMSASVRQQGRSRHTAWLAGLLIGGAFAAGCSGGGASTGPAQNTQNPAPTPDVTGVTPQPVTPDVTTPVAPTSEEIVALPTDPSQGAGGFKPSEKLDLLFVVDNSVSMGDKQSLFKEAVGDMIDQLISPPCLDTATEVFVDKDAEGKCPTGSKRIFDPVKDIHIGMLTSSLGPRGAVDDEIPLGCEDQPRGNDKAHLLPFVRDGLLETSSSNNQGFLVWDPEAKQTPPGETDIATLISKFQAQVDAVGEDGCGFEAPLEAAYRFLVDPNPYESVARVPCENAAADAPPLCAALQGTDQALLDQRAAFLRPDSVVVVMYLTDENDCSIRSSGQGFMAIRDSQLLGNGTAACATTPDSECCHSCNLAPEKIPATCPTAAANGCEGAPAVDSQEGFNIRCFNQKQRFGVDFLRSTAIYSQGFTGLKVGDRAGEPVNNPLVTAERGKEKVFVVGIVGVPWQSTASEETLASPNDLDLRREDQTDWNMFLGTDPGDAFNKESLAARTADGRGNPFTKEPIGGPGTWNSINGHDRPLEASDGLDDDLQYSCIFPLAEPRDCAAAGTNACDCYSETLPDQTVRNYAENNPLCWDAATSTYTSVQRYAKAYPGTRVIEVLKDVGVQGVLASICPKQSTEKTQQDYVYRPVIRALLLNVARQVPK